jgi:uncharacterized protein (DUF1778 family)
MSPVSYHYFKSALSEQDADKVFSLLENPPAPNRRLQEAAKKHKAFFSEAH